MIPNDIDTRAPVVSRHGIVGIHAWTFTPVAEGVRVDTAESWSGEPVEADRATMQDALDRALVAWLGHLEEAPRRR